MSARLRPLIVIAGVLVCGRTGSGAAAEPAPSDLPEDVFRGQIVLTRTRLPTSFPSKSAFIDALRAGKTEWVWSTAITNNGLKWNLEYTAFFAEPLLADQVLVRVYDVTGARLTRAAPRRVASDRQAVRDKGARIFAASIELSAPVFEGFRHYRMAIEVDGQVLAQTTFWLLAKLPRYDLALGPMTSAAALGPVDPSLPALVRARVSQDLGKLPPAARHLAPNEENSVLVSDAPMFYVNGTITRLDQTASADAATVACEMTAVVARWPSEETIWTTKDMTSATAGAGEDIASARIGCLTAASHHIGERLATFFTSISGTDVDSPAVPPPPDRPPAVPPGLTGVFELGADFGTNDLYTITYSDGSEVTVRANTGAFITAGISILPWLSGRARTRATFGVKATGQQAKNGNVDYYAFPLEVIETFEVGPLRVGAGLYALFGPRLKGTGVASNLNTTFDTSIGFTARAEWVFARVAGVGVRFAWNRLTSEGQSMSAPAIGFVLSLNGSVGSL